LGFVVVQVVVDSIALYQISQGYINAISQIVTLVLDFGMWGLSIWNVIELFLPNCNPEI
jgi:hypothetical protein